MASDSSDSEESLIGDDSVAGTSQDTGERRQLRSLYRKLINDLQGIGVEGEEDGTPTYEASTLLDQSATKLKEQLETVERLYTKVTHTREAALDSQVYSMIATSAKHKVQSLQSELFSFVPEEFAEKLKSFFDVDRVEYPNSLPNQVWVDLGRDHTQPFRKAVTYHFFSGSFDPGEVLPKVKQRKPRAVRDESSQKPTIVQQIAHNDKNYEEKTTEEVENVHNTLRHLFAKNDNQALCYFQFVIDPNSFSKTVENIFHTSFLVKDGEAKICYDEYQLPVIMPVEKKQNSNTGNDKFALALGISVSEWQELKTAFGIKKAVIGRKNNG